MNILNIIHILNMNIINVFHMFKHLYSVLSTIFMSNCYMVKIHVDENLKC